MAWSGVQKLDSEFLTKRTWRHYNKGRCGVFQKFTEYGHVATILWDDGWNGRLSLFCGRLGLLSVGSTFAKHGGLRTYASLLPDF